MVANPLDLLERFVEFRPGNVRIVKRFRNPRPAMLCKRSAQDESEPICIRVIASQIGCESTYECGVLLTQGHLDALHAARLKTLAMGSERFSPGIHDFRK